MATPQLTAGASYYRIERPSYVGGLSAALHTIGGVAGYVPKRSARVECGNDVARESLQAAGIC